MARMWRPRRLPTLSQELHAPSGSPQNGPYNSNGHIPQRTGVSLPSRDPIFSHDQESLCSCCMDKMDTSPAVQKALDNGTVPVLQGEAFPLGTFSAT